MPMLDIRRWQLQLLLTLIPFAQHLKVVENGPDEQRHGREGYAHGGIDLPRVEARVRVGFRAALVILLEDVGAHQGLREFSGPFLVSRLTVLSGCGN